MIYTLDNVQRARCARPDAAHLAAALDAVGQRGRREEQRVHGAVEEVHDSGREGEVVEEGWREARAVRRVEVLEQVGDGHRGGGRC